MDPEIAHALTVLWIAFSVGMSVKIILYVIDRVKVLNGEKEEVQKREM